MSNFSNIESPLASRSVPAFGHLQIANTDDVSCANAAFCNFFCDLCIRADRSTVARSKYNKNTLSSVQEEGTVAVGYLNWTHSLLLKT